MAQTHGTVVAKSLVKLAITTVALAATVFLFPQIAKAPNTSQPWGARNFATARTDFWLQNDSRFDAPKRSIVLSGTTLESVDTKAGEEMDESIQNSSKWYVVKVSPSGETGWAYRAWLSGTSIR